MNNAISTGEPTQLWATRDSAYIVRVVGDDHIPKRFSVWRVLRQASTKNLQHLANALIAFDEEAMTSGAPDETCKLRGRTGAENV
ncbi:MAG: hypothetical protein LBO00_07635 [Zoogloeaceae bacterium]|jgi:hypothetical protein|nr:hypothetical protein [Zoogloeaceae bacterium]